MKKNLSFLSLLIFISTVNLFAQSPWIWGRGESAVAAVVHVNFGDAVAIDSSANVYVTGEFITQTATFGSITLTNHSNSGDVFIAKYDSSGNVLWAKNYGRTGQEWARGACTDAWGNLYITGSFDSTTVFGSDTLINQGFDDVFIAKLDPNGNVLWARSAGGSHYDRGYSICVGKDGNAVITGDFSSVTIPFGSVTLSNFSTIFDFFIAKYDSSGNVLWAKSAGGSKADRGFSISTDLSDNAFVTGVFSSPSIIFGSDTLVTSNSTIGPDDIFLVKYDANGNVIWAQNIKGTADDNGNSVSTDVAGNVFVAGNFYSPMLILGSDTVINSDLSSVFSDVFVAKFDPNGNSLWARSAGIGNVREDCFGTCVNDKGDVYAEGWFRSDSILFNPILITAPVNWTDPLFIVKYDANGNVICGSALASGGDNVSGIIADRFGNVYLGSDYGTNSFVTNLFIVGPDTLISTVTRNVFVAKYNCDNIQSLNEFSNKKNSSVFPNPSNGNFTFLFPGTEKSELKIYNSLGEMIGSWKITNEKFEIDLSNQPNGIYFYQLKAEGENIFSSGKLVIEK